MKKESSSLVFSIIFCIENLKAKNEITGQTRRIKRLNQAACSRPSALLSPPIAITTPTAKPKQKSPTKFKPTNAKNANIYFFMLLEVVLGSGDRLCSYRCLREKCLSL